MAGHQTSAMQREQARRWLLQGQRRQEMLLAIHQPLTVKQLCKHLAWSLDKGCYVTDELDSCGLIECLNPEARRSRLYWLTPAGEHFQRLLANASGARLPNPFLPSIDWSLYGEVCFNHRRAVILVMDGPLQPAAIKRQALYHYPDIRISANNVRDIIKHFHRQDIVRPVEMPRRAHWHYELTGTGQVFQQLLKRAESGALPWTG